MKAASANLAAHLAEEVTSLATLWRITRKDGQQHFFTDHDRDIALEPETYRAAASYERSAVRTGEALAGGGFELAGIVDAVEITETDLIAGRFDGALVEIFVVNWAAPGDGTVQLKRGRLGRVRLEEAGYRAEFHELADALQTVVGEVYAADCIVDLGSPRCGVDLGPLTVNGTVTSVVDRRSFADTGLGEADGYWDFGLVSWSSGANAGLAMEVETYVQAGAAVTLKLDMPFDIEIGDAYAITPGCDKKLSTCRDKFDNVVNFRGFGVHLPGNEEILRYPDAK